jgi:hypothetical protein
MPLFTWLYSIHPLFTDCQRDDLGHFYFTCLKRALVVHFWNDVVFAAIYNELSLENLCWNYWCRYRIALTGSTDGFILFEQASHNLYRKLWLEKDIVVKHLRRSKRFVPYDTSIKKCLKWVESCGSNSSPVLDEHDLEILATFPETFM